MNNERNRCQSHFLENSDYSDSHDRIKAMEFSLECSTTNLMFSTENLIAEIEPLLPEKYHFERPEKNSTFWSFRTIRVRMRKSKPV